MTTAAETIVRKIALDNSGSVRVFESLGIGYCCGGNLPLKDACLRAHVSPDAVLKLLADLNTVRQGTPDESIDAPFAELAGHIVSRHHGYVRTEGPRLLVLLEKATSKHGAAHPQQEEIGAIFATVFQKPSVQVLKEEQVMFPFLNSLPCAVAGIATLSEGYRTPPGACPSYSAPYTGSAEFERDLHQHIHLENNTLFPRALEREQL